MSNHKMTIVIEVKNKVEVIKMKVKKINQKILKMKMEKNKMKVIKIRLQKRKNQILMILTKVRVRKKKNPVKNPEDMYLQEVQKKAVNIKVKLKVSLY